MSTIKGYKIINKIPHVDNPVGSILRMKTCRIKAKKDSDEEIDYPFLEVFEIVVEDLRDDLKEKFQASHVLTHNSMIFGEKLLKGLIEEGYLEEVEDKILTK